MFNISDFIPPHILKMSAYTPGLQVNDNVIKLNTNENPYPLPDFILEEIKHWIEQNKFHLYPDPISSTLRDKIAKIYNKNQDSVMIGNGSDDILSIVFRTLLKANDKILILDPSYSLYKVLAASIQVDVIGVPLNKDYTANLELIKEYNKKYQPTLVVITNPNAPTGIALSKKEILKLYSDLQKPILIDEAYVFFGGESIMKEAGTLEYPLLMACSTFSKAFSLAGLRLGWIVASHEFIKNFDKVRDSYNVNIFTQKVGEIVLNYYDYFINNIKNIINTREWFISKLNDLKFLTLPSQTNFVFTSPPDRNAKELYEYLFSNKILVRYFSDQPQFLRISIGTQKQMEILYEYIQKKYI